MKLQQEDLIHKLKSDNERLIQQVKMQEKMYG